MDSCVIAQILAWQDVALLIHPPLIVSEASFVVGIWPTFVSLVGFASRGSSRLQVLGLRGKGLKV